MHGAGSRGAATMSLYHSLPQVGAADRTAFGISGRGTDESEEEDRLLFEIDGVTGRRQTSEKRARRRGALIILAVIAGVLGGLALILGLVFGLHGRRVSQKCPINFKADEYDLRFFVIGDWGRDSNKNQRVAADMMASLGSCYRPDFIISSGDNFYEHGLKAVQDPLFTQTFTHVYSANSLMVPWYSILGNHDYGDSLDRWQLQSCSANSFDACPSDCCYSPKWQTNMTNLDWRWNCQQGAWKKSFLNGQLDIFFIDTTPLMPKYKSEPWASNAGGLNSQDPVAQRLRIKAMLSNSTAKWKLMIGHHPVISFGQHCGSPGKKDCQDMQWLQPLLKQHKVAAYFCGHEHDLQLIKDDADPVYYVVSGAGSNTRLGEFLLVNDPMLKFSADVQGFAAVSIKQTQLTVHMWVANSKKPGYTVDIPWPQ